MNEKNNVCYICGRVFDNCDVDLLENNFTICHECKNIEKKLADFLAIYGFELIDSWQNETTGAVQEKYRKDERDIIVEYINNNQ